MVSEIEHRWVAGAYDPVTALADKAYLEPHRASLARDLSGRVLDLGAGTGRMFPYLKTQHSGERRVSIHALEPDPHMYRRARQTAADQHLPVNFVRGRAEQLPYRTDSFDIVIAVMAFCTIAHPRRALDEVVRVLRPAGELRVLEHVNADGWGGRMQQWVRPLWRRVAGGCEPDRATDRLLREHPDLTPSEFDRLRIGVPPIRPFVRGRFHLVT